MPPNSGYIGLMQDRSTSLMLDWGRSPDIVTELVGSRFCFVVLSGEGEMLNFLRKQERMMMVEMKNEESTEFLNRAFYTASNNGWTDHLALEWLKI